MDIYLNNIGILEEANISLNGITVIAGLNDSGKSTIGKIAFSLIKAINFSESRLFVDNIQKQRELMDEIYIYLRNKINFDTPAIQRLFFPPEFERRFNAHKTKEFLDTEIQKLEKIEGLKKEDVSHLRILFNKISDLYFKESPKEERIVAAIKTALSKEFNGDLISKTKPGGFIELKEGSNRLLRISLTKNISKTEVVDTLIPFKEVTFIESPLVLNLLDTFRSLRLLSDMFYKRRELKSELHTQDLISKIELSNLDSDKKNDSFLNKISEITRVEAVFKKSTDAHHLRELVFEKKFSQQMFEIRNANAAMGIKSFAILGMLYRGGFLTPECLLVIDEPEVHLHPGWQVEYAFLLVELAKKGVKIILASHSPYIIASIEKLSKREGQHKLIKFYYAEKTETGLCKIVDKTNKLDEVYMNLSKPFNKVVFD